MKQLNVFPECYPTSISFGHGLSSMNQKDKSLASDNVLAV